MFKRLLGDRLGIDWKIATITVVSTLLIIADFYYTPTSGNHFDSLLYFIAIPFIMIIFIFRDSPADYGFVVGDWKIGLAFVFFGCLLMAPVIWFLGTREVGMQGYYNYTDEGLIWKKGLELFGWEYLFRGWILFGYKRKYQADALWLQAVPFAIAHLGKPDLETLSTIFGGFAFGWVAWRTGSFLYPFLIHWFISVLIVVVSAGSI
jgi:membrane protease YdiL (CAAX protease family)